MRSFLYLLPEVFLLATMIGILIGEITYHGERVRLVWMTAVIGLGAALLEAMLSYFFIGEVAFAGSIRLDGLGLAFRLFPILLGLLVLFASRETDDIAPNLRSEFYFLVIAGCLGISLVAMSANLLLLFVSLQLFLVSGHLLAGFSLLRPASSEAAIKHYLLSMGSSTFLLVGFILLHGSAQSLDIYEIGKVVQSGVVPVERVFLSFTLIVFSLCFLVMNFPFHTWVPDVLFGAPTPAAVFLAIGSRIAGFVIAVRIILVVFTKTDGSAWVPVEGLNWPALLGGVSALTMMIGGFLALRQQLTKRLLAYLVMSESGTLLLGVLVLDQVGLACVFYSILAQMFSLIGIYTLVAFFHRQVRDGERDQVSSMRGMIQRFPFEGTLFVLFLASFVGLPPFPESIGRFSLVSTLVQHGWHLLAFVVILTSAVAWVAAAKLAVSFFARVEDGSPFDPKTAEGTRVGLRIFLSLLLLPIFLLGLFAEGVLTWARQSLQFLL